MKSASFIFIFLVFLTGCQSTADQEFLSALSYNGESQNNDEATKDVLEELASAKKIHFPIIGKSEYIPNERTDQKQWHDVTGMSIGDFSRIFEEEVCR